ncbi:hypothetical protein [Nonomuraea dietziae]|uniref:hypothetical protein n=1 Tax=Nonomuraea dietziae TaxID=65515 RepID=UPI0031E0ADDE
MHDLLGFTLSAITLMPSWACACFDDDAGQAESLLVGGGHAGRPRALADVRSITEEGATLQPARGDRLAHVSCWPPRRGRPAGSSAPRRRPRARHGPSRGRDERRQARGPALVHDRGGRRRGTRYG